MVRIFFLSVCLNLRFVVLILNESDKLLGIRWDAVMIAERFGLV
jgi:hypothetical protein